MRPVTGLDQRFDDCHFAYLGERQRAIGSDTTIGELCLVRCLASRFVAAAAKDVLGEPEIAAIEWHGDPLVVMSAPRT